MKYLYRILIFYRQHIRCRRRCWKQGHACGCMSDVYFKAYPVKRGKR